MSPVLEAMLGGWLAGTFVAVWWMAMSLNRIAHALENRS